MTPRRRGVLALLSTALAVTAGVAAVSLLQRGGPAPDPRSVPQRPLVQSESGRTPRDAGAVDEDFDSGKLVDANGALAREKIPEWVPVLSSDLRSTDEKGRAGWARREDVFPQLFGRTEGLLPKPDRPMERIPIPVADADGHLVGHMYQGVGFVSLEESQRPGFAPAALATPVTTVVGQRR
jgi:hypothetical protein